MAELPTVGPEAALQEAVHKVYQAGYDAAEKDALIILAAVIEAVGGRVFVTKQQLTEDLTVTIANGPEGSLEITTRPTQRTVVAGG